MVVYIQVNPFIGYIRTRANIVLVHHDTYFSEDPIMCWVFIVLTHLNNNRQIFGFALSLGQPTYVLIQ
jgi:hypothetical protein